MKKWVARGGSPFPLSNGEVRPIVSLLSNGSLYVDPTFECSVVKEVDDTGRGLHWKVDSKRLRAILWVWSPDADPSKAQAVQMMPRISEDRIHCEESLARWRELRRLSWPWSWQRRDTARHGRYSYEHMIRRCERALDDARTFLGET